MCGRLNVSDNPLVIELLGQLGLPLWPQVLSQLRTSRFIRATNTVSMVMELQGQPVLQDAIWWLLLEPTATGFKPSSYTSFNTRSDKLAQRGTAGFVPFQQQRCIIPANGFGETEEIDGQTRYHDFVGTKALALGGIYRSWQHQATGEVCFSCSVITLPPHPKLLPYHKKAMPLLLAPEQYAGWLSSESDPQQLLSWLKPKIPQQLIGFQIDKPNRYQKIGPQFVIEADS